MTKETGTLVQKLRLQRGWSQEQLAQLSVLSARTIQRIEHGQPASAESLKALASVFEVDFSILREPEMDKPNTPNVSNEDALAFTRIRRIKGFYLHLVQFFSVVGILAIVNLISRPHYLWAGWVALGWGSGVVIHGLRVFDKLPFLSATWERRQVERYLGRPL